MEESFYIGVRIPKATHDAIRKLQRTSPIHVSLNAVVRHLLNEALGLEKPTSNGKRERK